MARAVKMDQFHLTIYVPQGLAPAEYDAIRRTLDDARFHAVLRRAVRKVVRAHPALAHVRVALSR
jgi:hypothetical protein